MAGWTLSEMERELKRQRGRLADLMSRIDVKNLEKAEANQRLLKRRKSYVPKNNGKGRPPLPLMKPSREDEARRLKYLIEIGVIDLLLQRPSSSVEAALARLDAVRIHLRGSVPTNPDHRLRKVEQLLGQFGDRRLPRKARPAEGPKPWSENEVRDVLGVAREFQKARLAMVNRLPIRTLAEQDVEDQERARLAVLERFLWSRYLDNAAYFLERASLVRFDVEPYQNAHDKNYYAVCWCDAVDDLIAKLRLDFVMGP